MKRSLILLYIFLLSFQFYSCYRSNIWDKGGQKIDIIPPTLLSASAINNTQIAVYFSDASAEIDEESAEDPANYSIPGLSITGAARDTADFTMVVLTTESQQNTSYTVTVTNVMDKFLNRIQTQNTASFIGDALPYILAVYPVNNTTIRVEFSEPVNGLAIADFGITPALALSNPVDISNGIIYEFTTASQNASAYTLQISMISGIVDATGNSIDAWNSIDIARKQGNFTGDALPYIVGINLITSTEIEVIFSEDVEISTSQDGTNYTIPGITIKPSASRHISPDLNIVTIYLSTPLSDSTLYNLTVSDVIDNQGVPGNLISTFNNPYSFTTGTSYPIYNL